MKGLRRQRGVLLISIVAVALLAALTALVLMVGDLVTSQGRQTSASETSLLQIRHALVQYASTNGYLPCPADPTALDNTAGIANGGTVQTAGATCTYRTNGVVPWSTLHLTQSEVTDDWGRLISYRVYDGTFGLVQPNGASALDCDTTNAVVGSLGAEETVESPPSSNGLCNVDHQTLSAHFITSSSPSYQKGLAVLDFGTAYTDVAFVLISHGPTGRGGYLPSGVRMEMPNANALDRPNAEATTTQFVRMERSGGAVKVNDSGHYDDTLSYLRIDEFLKLAGRSARDWPDKIFTATTTAGMNSPSSDAANPHFITGITSDQGFSVQGGAGTVLQAGNAAGSYSSCLWWPNVLTLVSGNVRKKLVGYVEFSATDNSSDVFAGFTMGFLSSTDAAAPPLNSTCGTGIGATTTGTGSAGQRNIVVASVTGISLSDRVFGNGVPFGATVSLITSLTRTVQISSNLTGALVNSPVNFANGNQVRRDLGWAGGTLANYSSRFAVEFDANTDSLVSTPAGNDPTSPSSRPHLAVDFTGITHGTDAGSCSPVGNAVGSELPCDSQTTTFPSVTTTTATGLTGSSTIVVSSNYGIANGMTITGTGIPASTTVTTVSGNSVGLTKALTADLANTSVTFASLSTSNFMQNGTSVFHNFRVEVSPKDCIEKSGTLTSDGLTVDVGDASQVQTGQSVYGNGVAYGATVSSISGSIVTLSRAHVSSVASTLVFANSVPIVATADGTVGNTTIQVVNASGIVPGFAAYSPGIAAGSVVSSVVGNTITLSAAIVSNMAKEEVHFSPSRTLVEAWTFSNAGCAQDSVSCSAMKDLQNNFVTNNNLAVSTMATGSLAATTITVPSATGIIPSMAVTGTGIGSGATVVSVSGTTVTLSVANTAAITEFSGRIVFRNRYAMHAVSCVPASATASAYDALFVGLTTANNTIGSAVSTGATGTSGQFTIAVTSATNIAIGMSVRGTGIGNDALVTAISGTTITLSVANAGAVSRTVRFAGGSNVFFQGLLINGILLP